MNRALRGICSSAGVLLHPVGRLCGPMVRSLREESRYANGLVLVLPGIEGQSLMNHSIACGLCDGGVTGAIEIYDWTTGLWPLLIYHLRGQRRHARQARLIANRIAEYQAAWPGRPVHLVGHSGGAAMALLALEQLPAGRQAKSAVLLAPATSPEADLTTALANVEQGVWNYYSPLDFLILGAGTMLLGTFDGKHQVASGARGFIKPPRLTEEGNRLYQEKLFQVPYRASMALQFHWGGHAGCTNRVFVAEEIAPLLRLGTARPAFSLGRAEQRVECGDGRVALEGASA
jgi:pimeloyl-ACP methyl ester carboxylesterase